MAGAETEVKGAADRSGPAAGRSEAAGRASGGRASAVEAAGKAVREAMSAERTRRSLDEKVAGALQGAANAIDPDDDPDTIDRARGGLDPVSGTPASRAAEANERQAVAAEAAADAAIEAAADAAIEAAVEAHFEARAQAARDIERALAGDASGGFPHPDTLGHDVAVVIAGVSDDVRAAVAETAMWQIDNAIKRAEMGEGFATPETIEAVTQTLAGHPGAAEFEAARAANLQNPDSAVADIDAAAADVVALSRHDPTAAKARYAALTGHFDNGPKYARAVDALLAQEVAASDRLLAGAAFTPQRLDSVRAAADGLMAAHAPQGHVDVESLGHALVEMATADASLAVAAKTEVSARLSAAEAVALNRQIAGDYTVLESLELGFENPGQAAVGAGKGLVNSVTGTAELLANTLNRFDTAAHTGLGVAFGALGLDGWAKTQYDLAAHYREARLARDWTLDPANAAEAFGMGAATLAELATGVGALRKGAVTGARYADEAIDAAAVMRTQADEILGEVHTVEIPPGYRAGYDYSPTGIANARYGELLTQMKGPPPANMYDPHAHHALFKVGNGAQQQELVREGQAIVRSYDIDPIFGLENLTWAPNRVPGQHSIDALRPLVEELRRLAADLSTPRDAIVETLERFGRIAAGRKP